MMTKQTDSTTTTTTTTTSSPTTVGKLQKTSYDSTFFTGQMKQQQDGINNTEENALEEYSILTREFPPVPKQQQHMNNDDESNGSSLGTPNSISSDSPVNDDDASCSSPPTTVVPPPHNHINTQIRQRRGVNSNSSTPSSTKSSPADDNNVVVTPPIPSSFYGYDQARGTAFEPTPHGHTSGESNLNNNNSNNGGNSSTQQQTKTRKRSSSQENEKSPYKVPTVAPFNNPAKKVYFNKTFIEGVGLSYATVQRHQIQQQKDDEHSTELKHVSINMNGDYEKDFDGGYAPLATEEEEELDNLDDYEISDDLQSSTTKTTTWSEYWAHHKNAFSLVRVVASQWSWGELTLGLEYYTRSQAQATRDYSQFMADSEVYHKNIIDNELQIWKRYARFTYQVFREPVTHLPKKTNINVSDIICFDKTQQTMRPAYFLCLDHPTKSVVLIFRGTKSFSDLITDLHCSSIRYKHGYCHKGILCAAQWFKNNGLLRKIIKRTLERNPSYKLRLCGHSLGGGTAAILTDLWKMEDEFPGVDIHCYAFACPPVLSQVLAVECASYVTTFVNGDDFVTRLSMTAIEELRKDVSAYPWKEEMMRDIQNSAIVKFAAGVKNVATGIFSKGVGLFYKKTTTVHNNALNTDETQHEIEEFAKIYPTNMTEQQIMDFIEKARSHDASTSNSITMPSKMAGFPPLPTVSQVVETAATEIVKEIVEKDMTTTTVTQIGVVTEIAVVEGIQVDQPTPVEPPPPPKNNEVQSPSDNDVQKDQSEPIVSTDTTDIDAMMNVVVATSPEVNATVEIHSTTTTTNNSTTTTTTTQTTIHNSETKENHNSESKETKSKNNSNNSNKKKKKKEKDSSPFIINDYENLVVSLFPAGKVYQMRNLNNKVYIKESGQDEFSKLILSETWKEDHRMIHYLRNLEYFTDFMKSGDHESSDVISHEDVHLVPSSPEQTRHNPKQQQQQQQSLVEDSLSTPPIPTHLLNSPRHPSNSNDI
jgi:hypothetical protein